MDEKIKEQILYIRVSGLTNMFDVTMVQRLANEYGFYELVIFLEENRADYVISSFMERHKIHSYLLK